jgi:hypothetical protein
MDVQEYTVTKAAADSEAPSGAWAHAPSLAASTVEMENTSGFPVWVDVVAGTVTVIKVEGETTGLTSGSFLLQDKQAIAVTYSVAPTLSWRYQAPNPWKPKGAWASAPSIATSTTAMPNTSGAPLVVYISAGTVTVVKVNGVTTGLTTPGSVRLGPGDTLAITYSVAPTLAWIYE